MQGNSFKALKIVHTTLCIGLALFVMVSYVLVSQKVVAIEKDATMEMVFQGIAAVISIGCLLSGFSLFKKQAIAARNAEPGEVRFEMYRGACIMWWALLEAPGIFSVIAYLKTGNIVFIFLTIFHLSVLLIFKPRKDNIVVLLNLTSQDIQKLEGGTF
jgi:hypothetical protein